MSFIIRGKTKQDEHVKLKMSKNARWLNFISFELRRL